MIEMLLIGVIVVEVIVYRSARRNSAADTAADVVGPMPPALWRMMMTTKAAGMMAATEEIAGTEGGSACAVLLGPMPRPGAQGFRRLWQIRPSGRRKAARSFHDGDDAGRVVAGILRQPVDRAVHEADMRRFPASIDRRSESLLDEELSNLIPCPVQAFMLSVADAEALSE